MGELERAEKEALDTLLAESARAIDAASVRCSKCGGTFVSVTPVGDAVLCRGCHKATGDEATVRNQAEAIWAELGKSVDGWLVGTGMSDREAAAVMEKVGADVLRAISGSTVADESMTRLVQGEVPRYGFGLVGNAGVGKTFALAAIFRVAAREWIDKNAGTWGFRVLQSRPWVSWLNWPDRAAKIRTTSLEDGGHAEIAEWVEAWSEAKALVIDDIGAERMRAVYSEDFATEQLDRVIDFRERWGLPTWYTTNLAPEKMLARYGSRIFSRLTRRNPPLIVGAKTDRRGVEA